MPKWLRRMFTPEPRPWGQIIDNDNGARVEWLEGDGDYLWVARRRGR